MNDGLADRLGCIGQGFSGWKLKKRLKKREGFCREQENRKRKKEKGENEYIW